MGAHQRRQLVVLRRSGRCRRPPPEGLAPLRFAANSRIDRRTARLWSIPCMYVPRVRPSASSAPSGRVHRLPRSRLDGERMRHGLVGRHAHVDFVGRDLRAVASRQEAAPFRNPSGDLVCRLAPQEGGRALQQSKPLRLGPGRLHAVRVQQPLAQHLVPRADTDDRDAARLRNATTPSASPRSPSQSKSATVVLLPGMMTRSGLPSSSSRPT